MLGYFKYAAVVYTTKKKLGGSLQVDIYSKEIILLRPVAENEPNKYNSCTILVVYFTAELTAISVHILCFFSLLKCPHPDRVS